MRTRALFNFIEERHSIYERRSRNEPKPWTKDKILQSYRFCNVYRELDTQTLWFAEHWRRKHKDLWFAALVFRFINLDETAKVLGFPIPWNEAKFRQVLAFRKANGLQCFNGAYIVSTNGNKEEKHLYLAKILSKAWLCRDEVRYREGETLRAFYDRLTQLDGVGSFMAAQVVADCKYESRYEKAPDWYTFAAFGPGSKRGLNRVIELPPETRWNEQEWNNTLALLHRKIEPLVLNAGMFPLHAQDLQNCLCEFDKYERVRLGEGRPKSLYNGGKDD